MATGWLDLSYQQLLQHLADAQGDTNREMARAFLEIKNMEAQGRTAEQLVASTDRLVRATRVLGWFTLALVGVTVVLVWATVRAA